MSSRSATDSLEFWSEPKAIFLEKKKLHIACVEILPSESETIIEISFHTSSFLTG